MNQELQAILLLGIMLSLTLIQLHWNGFLYIQAFKDFPAVCQGLWMLAIHLLQMLFKG